MTTTLITGANKGLGYETARRLLGDGHDVWVAARDPDRGAAAAERLGARFVALDVTDEASVAAAADVVARAGGLDVLINNAGIVDPNGPAADILLLGYPSSKAALNMLTIKWARAHPRWRVNAADPGFTATDLNSQRGTQTVHEGTEAIVRLASIGPDGPTGTFADRLGAVPW